MRRSRRSVSWIAGWVAIAGCGRGGRERAGVEAGESVDTGALSRARESGDAGARAGASGSAALTVPGEAQRTWIARLEDDVALRPFGVTLREHFGPGARGPFVVQQIELPGGLRTALLVSRADGSAPLVLAVERDVVLWSKPRPTWGLVAPVIHLTIAPRPDGVVVLFGWVAPLHTVAARMWADDGNAFGDFEVFAPPACESLSAARAPGARGWIVVCASTDGTRAERLAEQGTSAWGPGLRVGSGNAPGGTAVSFDSDDSWVLLERSAAVGGDRLLAFRYGLVDGAPLWSAPVDLGVIAAPRSGDGRFASMTADDGRVRVGPLAGVAALRDHGLTIESDAAVRR
jgi:hypothetical protein